VDRLEIIYCGSSSSEYLFDPHRATEKSSGIDLQYIADRTMPVRPGQTVLVPTGMIIKLDEGFEAQVRTRSGMAYKHGIVVLNSPGTIDADYTGEIKVIIRNMSLDTFVIVPGTRIAQLVIAPVSLCTPVVLRDGSLFEETERGAGGFGSTGT
jgi:dUTP pyrophosphatase